MNASSVALLMKVRSLVAVSLVVVIDAPLVKAQTIYLDRAQQGMVTSAHPIASEIGLSILKQGGNAIDAAVATTLAISVAEPFSAGIGGGGFLMFYQAQKNETKALDFRERAPLKATQNMYLDAQGKVRPNSSINGYLAVATPGTIAGLYEAHRQYGKLPWKTVVAPSVNLAQSGFPVSHRFTEATTSRKFQNAEAQKIFTHQGKPYQPGEIFKQPDLATTLSAIAVDPNSFYQGKIANAIVNDMRVNKGLITLEDLKQYRPIWRTPVCGDFRQARVCSMPPPSSGGVHLIQMLNLVSDTDLKTMGWRNPDSLHLLAESMRIAYADRATYLGDPDFVKVPVSALISPAYAKLRRSEINPKKAALSVKPGDSAVLQKLSKESTETSHLTVVDRDRNAVSLTFTINLGFGAGIVAKGTGIVLNNEMDDFAIAPNTPNAFGLVGGQANAIAPRKTPLSSMTPTIITENGKLRMVVGAPGGSTIITTVLQSILNVLVYEMDVRQAISAPRIHHQWQPDRLNVEQRGLDPLTISDLQRRGHQIYQRGNWGNANAIVVRPDGGLEGAADPRGEGTAAGY
ncbi:gamma-glutamyltransferase [Leptolyngbya boryana CZ1]|uniref:Glutathione hydrolase proenzyme n=1 Tax=Leptolyngbya boryana CZ1 TaxID=3060204 RepID=A0AA96X150_LEPBY|nr:gamma-glutamyltransferase [Leptolyngbya boryana]WNZ49122.1 gamma-glutamyltransferase [Leptolyngbya boryana CZ1]